MTMAAKWCFFDDTQIRDLEVELQPVEVRENVWAIYFWFRYGDGPKGLGPCRFWVRIRAGFTEFALDDAEGPEWYTMPQLRGMRAPWARVAERVALCDEVCAAVRAAHVC
jgi:hypothetical protein